MNDVFQAMYLLENVKKDVNVRSEEGAPKRPKPINSVPKSKSNRSKEYLENRKLLSALKSLTECKENLKDMVSSYLPCHLIRHRFPSYGWQYYVEGCGPSSQTAISGPSKEAEEDFDMFNALDRIRANNPRKRIDFFSARTEVQQCKIHIP